MKMISIKSKPLTYHDIVISLYRDIKGAGMPELVRFNGIVIRMYYGDKDHNPPHVHASFGSNGATVDISSGEIVIGKLPRHVRSQVKDWILENRDELLEIWNTQTFHKIEDNK